jgi:hypothetical protein
MVLICMSGGTKRMQLNTSIDYPAQFYWLILPQAIKNKTGVLRRVLINMMTRPENDKWSVARM